MNRLILHQASNLMPVEQWNQSSEMANLSLPPKPMVNVESRPHGPTQNVPLSPLSLSDTQTGRFPQQCPPPLPFPVKSFLLMEDICRYSRSCTASQTSKELPKSFQLMDAALRFQQFSSEATKSYFCSIDCRSGSTTAILQPLS